MNSMSGLEAEVHEDVVGNRVLTGVQLVDISRLSAHPIPMISGGLVTVAGQGPKDSNGAGKSSFIAAISLLSADEQWRLASGASSAAELLFTAEIAAQDGRWSNVDRGYVIGVFTDPQAQDPAGWTASALSVWLRINRKAPYIDLRWEQGLYVPAGSSETERVAQVDALWARMERRKIRTDLHANRLAESLYGPHVRCVSFLSTSVRASPTANLLAQPLNELTPSRIFDAIATLTGLDRELEHEQALRSNEFLERSKVAEARADLERWEQQMDIVEAGIQRRVAARTQLEHSRTLWIHHTAKHVVEGHEQRAVIKGKIAELKAQWQERRTHLETLRGRLEALKDEGFDQRCTDAEKAWQRLNDRDQKLAAQLTRHSEKVEELQRQQVRLRDESREADGRDPATAKEEKSAAEAILTMATELIGAAKQAHQEAKDRLAEAEAGQGLAAAQLRRLDGIPAAALLDIVTLDQRERDVWEPRLVPYREAVVVAAGRANDALERVATLPGSILVIAGPAPDNRELPVSADPQLDVGHFLAALEDRAADGTTDEAAGILIVGGFPDPITGRAARIAIARTALEHADTTLGMAQDRVNDARRQLTRADRRLRGAESAEKLVGIAEQIEDLRTAAEEAAGERTTLQPPLKAAWDAFIQLRAAKQNRQDELGRINRSITAQAGLQQTNELERANLVQQDIQIGLDGRLRR